MPNAAFGRLWHDYISAMAACLLQLHAGASGGSPADSTSERLVSKTPASNVMHRASLDSDSVPIGGGCCWGAGRRCARYDIRAPGGSHACVGTHFLDDRC